MENSHIMDSELFITRVRWLVIFGMPAILWFYWHRITAGLIIVSIVFFLFNLLIEACFLKRLDISRYSLVLSVIDTVYLSYIYYLTLSGPGALPQLFYFLILVMGIRHGLARYHWIVLISSLLYIWLTIGSAVIQRSTLNPITVLIQLLFFTAFGVMSSYIFRRDYRQRLEKEDLITELQAAYQQLCVYNAQVEELANTDPLTGLYNYRFFTERLEREMDLAKRFNTFLSLIILDIDHFKDFNDAYGHPAGDRALREVARIFRQNVRDKDILCRYGGEEFLVLLPSTGIEEAFKCAERMREAVQHYPVTLPDSQRSVNVTVSGGVACYPLDAGNGEQLLRIADEVLYSAKHKGRNKIHRRL